MALSGRVGAAGRVRRRKPWMAIAGGLVAVAVRIVVAPYLSVAVADTCVTKGISTSPGREGICTRFDSSYGGPTTFNVVDSGHVLKMPGYDARLMASVITPTPIIGVPPTAANAHDYPNGHGMLVSFELLVTNEQPVPVEFDQGAQDTDLGIATQNPANGFARPQVPYPGTNAPAPQLDEEGSIPPHGTSTGWISFIVPVWAPPLLNARGTDLELDPIDSMPYVGQIRLWKAANLAGRAAIRFHRIAPRLR